MLRDAYAFLRKSLEAARQSASEAKDRIKK